MKNNKITKLLSSIILVVLCALGYVNFNENGTITPNIEQTTITEDGEYTYYEDVALYIHLFNHLPSNYISKYEAKNLGWVAEEENLWEVTEQKIIGGDSFMNLEGLLPKDKKYKECDVNYYGGARNEDRIIYSKDGYIYYTDDHYRSFVLLYEPND